MDYGQKELVRLVMLGYPAAVQQNDHQFSTWALLIPCYAAAVRAGSVIYGQHLTTSPYVMRHTLRYQCYIKLSQTVSAIDVLGFRAALAYQVKLCLHTTHDNNLLVTPMMLRASWSGHGSSHQA